MKGSSRSLVWAVGCAIGVLWAVPQARAQDGQSAGDRQWDADRVEPAPNAEAETPAIELQSAPPSSAAFTDAQAALSAESNDPYYLETLEVTAQRRIESIQDVPVAVAAFSAETLHDRGINTPIDLQFMVPGMVYTASGPYTFPYLRGVGSNAFVPSVDSSIATLLDGVYSASIMTSFRNFADIARIEVLKGPQGTLFGRNTTAGVISITTRTPENFFASSGSLYAGSLNRAGASAYLAGPVSEQSSLSISGYLERFDHHYENINPDGPQPGDAENWGLRLKNVAQLSERVALRLHGFVTLEDGAGSGVWENIQPSSDARAAGAQTVSEPRKINNNWPAESRTRVIGTDAKVTVALDNAEFWSLTAYQHTKYAGGTDLDGSNADYVAVYVPDLQFARSFSQEFQIASTGTRTIEWLAGAYLSKGLGGWSPIIFAVGPATTLETALLQQVRSQGEDSGASIGPDAVPGSTSAPTLFEIFGIVSNDAHAAFGELSYRFTEHFALTGGLRYSNEQRNLVRGSTAVYLAGQPDEPTTVRDFRNLPAQWDNWSPKLGIEWQKGDFLTWLTFAQGFKSGTWNPLPLLEPVSLVDPEEIDSWDTGFKADFWNGRLRVNGSAYWYDYRDLQVFVISVKSNGTAKVENAGRADIKGAELDIQLRPAQDWLWTASGAYTNSRYIEFVGTGYDEDGEPFQGDFSGNRLMYAPVYTLSTELQYSLGFGGNVIDAAINYYRSDAYFFDAQNDFEHPAYGLWGARLAWHLPSRNLKLALIASNLTNTDYKNLGVLYDYGRVVSDAPGRQFLLRLNWDFSG